MNLFAALKSALLGMPAVTAIVGGTSATTRIWNSWPRTYSVPCIVMEIDSEAEQNYLNTGTGDGIIGQVAITCRAASVDAARTLRSVVRSGLAGYSGSFTAILDSSVSSDTPKAEGSADHWCDQVLDFTMLYAEGG